MTLRHREGLARSGHAQQHLAQIAAVQPLDQLGDRPRLVAFQLEIGDEFEFVVERRHSVDRTAGNFAPC